MYLTMGYHVDHSCADDVDGAGGIDMADVQLLVAHVFDPAGHLLNCPVWEEEVRMQNRERWHNSRIVLAAMLLCNAAAAEIQQARSYHWHIDALRQVWMFG